MEIEPPHSGAHNLARCKRIIKEIFRFSRTCAIFLRYLGTSIPRGRALYTQSVTRSRAIAKTPVYDSGLMRQHVEGECKLCDKCVRYSPQLNRTDYSKILWIDSAYDYIAIVFAISGISETSTRRGGRWRGWMLG